MSKTVVGKKKEIFIFGMGNLGQGLASYFLSNGFKVEVWNRPNKKKYNELKNNYFYYNNKPVGKVLVSNSNIQKLKIKPEMIIIATTANAHDKIIRSLAGKIKNKLILIIPGCFGSFYEFSKLTGNHIFEINPSPISTRVTTVGSFSYFRQDFISNYLIGSKNIESKILEIFANGKFCHPLKSSLSNLDMILHPTIALGNIKKKNYFFYRDGINSTIEKQILLIDEERIDLGKKFNFELSDIRTSLKLKYELLNNKKYPNTLISIFKTTEPYKSSQIIYSKHVNRFIEEEVPFRLVPFYFLGIECGLKMINTRKIIDKACKIFNIDYYKLGRRIALDDIHKIDKHLYTFNKIKKLCN